MQTRLDNLSKNIIALKQQALTSRNTYPHARPFTHLEYQKADLPPIQKAVNVIRIAKGTNSAPSDDIGLKLKYRTTACRNWLDLRIPVPQSFSRHVPQRLFHRRLF